MRRNARANKRVYSLGQVAGLGELSQIAFAQAVKVRIGGRHVCDSGNLMRNGEVCFLMRRLSAATRYKLCGQWGGWGGLRECFKAGLGWLKITRRRQVNKRLKED